MDLFPGGPGNTFGSAVAHRQIMDGLEQRVFGRLPDSTHVYPGHGDDTTLGAERPHLPEWRERAGDRRRILSLAGVEPLLMDELHALVGSGQVT